MCIRDRILSGLHIADTLWRIVLFQMSCMTGYCNLNSKGCKCKIDCFQLIVIIGWNHVGVGSQIIDQFLAALLAQSRKFRHTHDIGCIHDSDVYKRQGVACVFMEIGQDVHIVGNLEEAVNEGVRQGYTEGCLRKSVVRDPLDRVNTCLLYTSQMIRFGRS